MSLHLWRGSLLPRNAAGGRPGSADHGKGSGHCPAAHRAAGPPPFVLAPSGPGGRSDLLCTSYRTAGATGGKRPR
ncbi:Hypothetical Protein RSKD131_1177 [Cereibacter sphaeroides KD131]|nr:Hypothetical Protein RSKD131_1177 [Cereibacter sphaeroides KD131]